jgi:hypothetical protein
VQPSLTASIFLGAHTCAALAGAQKGPVVSISEAGLAGTPFVERDIVLGAGGLPAAPGTETLQVTLVATWQLID